MKKQYYILLSVLSLMGLSACQNDEIISSKEESVLAFHTTTQIESRTSLVDGKTVVWNEGDAVAVYDFVAPKREFTAEISGNTVHFSGNITPKYGSFVAAYPYELAAENNVNRNILMYLPAEQTAVADGFSDDLNLSIAKGERNVDGSPSEVRFRNVCQLVKLSVPEYADGRIAKIEFTASTAIAGQLTIDYNDYDPVVSTNQQGAKTVALFPPSNSNSFAQGSYYFVLAPVEMNGFTIKITDTTGKTYTQHSNSTIGGIRGFIYNIGTLDMIEKPVITPQHVYDNGTLVGTKVTLTAPVSDKAWSAVIKNANGEIVRTLSEAAGTLTTDHTDATWPYLPKGNYTVDYTFTTANGKQKNATTGFSITENPNFSLSMTANSTYSYYQAGNVDKANSMDAYAVDGITTTVNGISQVILANSNYAPTRANTFNGTEAGYESGVTSYNGITISLLGESTLNASFTFDGVTKNASQKVYITGLPFNHQPPTSDKWTANNGQTSFNGDHVKTGAAGSDGEFSYSGVLIPAGTKLALEYRAEVYMDNALSTQRYQISVGNQKFVDFSTSDTGTKRFDESKILTLTSEARIIKCYTGYCYGRANSKTYKIALSYSK